MAACTTSAPPPATPTPPATRKDSVAPPTPAARWNPRRVAGSWRYELHSSGTVSLAGDSTADSLPLGRTVLYTVTIAPADGQAIGSPAFAVTGSVDSVTVSTPERVPTPTAGSNSNPHFQAALAADGQLISLTSNATTPCQGATDPLSAAASMLFVTLPAAISPQESWSDTVSTVTCRGRMPMIATTTRQYRAVTDTVWRGRPALLLTRTDSLDIESRSDSGSIGTTDSTGSMKATGKGHAAFTLYVDPRSGVLLEAAGRSHTDILVTTGNSSFPFREDARQTIALLR